MIGSKDDPLPPPPASSPSPPSAVCCMCGDDGLVRELFRCRVCFFRFQHRYCSNLYPKAEAYRTCNWCLKGVEAMGNLPSAATRNSAFSSISLPIAQRSSGGGGRVKLVRRSFSDPLKPIKKQGLPERRQPGGGQLSAGGITKRRQFLRVKVRRYKLLEEVSS